MEFDSERKGKTSSITADGGYLMGGAVADTAENDAEWYTAAPRYRLSIGDDELPLGTCRDLTLND